jgi:hypothetical protein
MLKLENLILNTFNEKNLHEIETNYNFLNIHDEWVRRLNSCDPNLYLPVLEYILEKKIQKTYQIEKSLHKIKNSFPWKIGVVYDYRTGHVKNIEIRIGNNFGKYNVNNKPLSFNWLYVNTNKLLMREIVSENCNPTKLTSILDEESSEQIRNFILSNKRLTVNVMVVRAEIGNSFRSLPNTNPLDEGEEFIVYPYEICSETIKMKLVEDMNNSIILQYKNINIKTSIDVDKYMETISY